MADPNKLSDIITENLKEAQESEAVSPTQAGPATSVNSHYARGASQQLGVSTLFGFATGAALTRYGSKMAGTITGFYGGLQTASYLGIIDINWIRMNETVVCYLDTDGDKELTFKDLDTHMKRYLPVFCNTTGFVTGLAAGLKFKR